MKWCFCIMELCVMNITFIQYLMNGVKEQRELMFSTSVSIQRPQRHPPDPQPQPPQRAPVKLLSGVSRDVPAPYSYLKCHRRRRFIVTSGPTDSVTIPRLPNKEHSGRAEHLTSSLASRLMLDCTLCTERWDVSSRCATYCRYGFWYSSSSSVSQGPVDVPRHLRLLFPGDPRPCFISSQRLPVFYRRT